MRTPVFRLLVIAVLAGFLVAGTPLAPSRTPAARAQSTCPNATLPPPPGNTSEEPAPGQREPAPLPVPEDPAGGQQLGACGLVLPPGAPQPPRPLTAKNWLIQDMDSGEVLAAHHPHGRQRPASLIKTLLALVVIDELDPNQVVVPNEEDADQECSCAGIEAGSPYRVRDLLLALLMKSGNDVAHALANALGGVPQALDKMNTLAHRLGATDTRAATPSGLDGPGMVTSAYDQTLLFTHAMTKPAYAEAVRTKRMQFPGARGEPSYPLVNDNRLLEEYPGFLGGKTGFTDASRHTYVGAAERDGRRLSVVLLRAEQKPIRVSEQAMNMLDYGFELAAAGTPAVGRVTTAPPQPQAPARTDAPDSQQATSEGERSATGARAADSGDGTSGVGWVIGLVILVSVGVGVGIALSRDEQV
ncbi:D-alanyl-D-alanine carboxypeptidase family protein [Prauserella rugosa]|uniref:D-alanyl-D-alanine carboxypeptidase (Penicillin-binding protein 5/6) n=1 Tax=Prauserella rugosa TaxID=43354 RepID=A0A660CFW2_9PSEU|nr:D-alanyl-D-alanine carboxypeptidase family protein [Prauserella rugosa]TWH22332.1 D-alanyl-D-alanine carboxypeptidase (penicillin-binding protein 5/6) [Prauserella rugosa]